MNSDGLDEVVLIPHGHFVVLILSRNFNTLRCRVLSLETDTAQRVENTIDEPRRLEHYRMIVFWHAQI